VKAVELKVWSPFADLEKEWRFDFPRLLTTEFRPAIDVVRSENEIVLTAELPGMTPDDVDVSLDGDILTIKGEKSDEREISEDDRYVRERSFGSFTRRITVPEGVTAESIEANFDSGVLTVEVKLPEEKMIEPRHIPVGAK
jgi:HSP20 family protein